jgi:hypothetical protein
MEHGLNTDGSGEVSREGREEGEDRINRGIAVLRQIHGAEGGQ